MMIQRKHIFSLLYISVSLICSLREVSVLADQPTHSHPQKTISIQPKTISTNHSEQVSELITPKVISLDQGASYIARLSMPRAADRESTSQCILLEDGKPLPHPHALHRLIRKQGRGHYSHWTTTTLYFSASDSSDPRTNGKKYELVSTESYAQKKSSFILSSPQTVVEFPSISQHHIQPVKMVWQNLESQTRVSPSWKRKGSPDLTSQESMLSSILKPGMNAEEKSLAIWKFLVDWRYHYFPAEEGDEIHDPVKFLNVYGYGFCDDCARNFAVLGKKAGLQTRVWGLDGHVVGEVFYNGRWHMFDPDHQVFYRNQQGVIAGVEELSQHPELITKTRKDPIGSPSTLIAQLYTSTDNNRVDKKQISINDTVLSPVLEPLDRVEFRYTQSEFVHRKGSVDSPMPPVAGNGTLKRSVPLVRQLKQTSPGQRQWQLKWPYVFLKGSLNIELESPQEIPAVYISSNKNSWERLKGLLKKNSLRVSFDQWIQNHPTAVYECFIRFENPDKTDPAKSIQRLDAELIFQFAPRALAHIDNKNNIFEMNLTSATSNHAKGLKVQLVWKETE